MAEFLSPGVYVIEESSGIKPITGVSTSTAAFVGITERGPINKAAFISSFSQYMDVFGGFIEEGVLPFSVYQFFKEGGARCFVTRVAGDTADKAEANVPATAKVEASSEGTWGNKLSIVIEGGSIKDSFRMKVKKFIKKVGDKDVYQDLEVFDNLTVANAEDTINKTSKYITFDITGDTNPSNTTAPIALTGGKDGLDISNITSAFFIGTDADKKGLHSFDTVDEINIVAIPDAAFIADKKTDETLLKNVTNDGMSYCENRKDCFFIADSPFGKKPSEIKTYKEGIASDFGALYYPWLSMSHPATGQKKMVPPSGAMAGIYANTDIKVGVHKAPAGLATAVVKSASDLELQVTKGEHDLLNPVGINVIRYFSESGIVVWGARTTSSDPEWRYVNVRRLFLYIEESIDEGTQWVVFEPNRPSLWGRVKLNITAFLTTVWRSGALFGTTPEQAFYVKVDEENNPQSERDQGKLNIEVGIAAVKPAEFVIIRISQKMASA